jgi:hypothetical protein
VLMEGDEGRYNIRDLDWEPERDSWDGRIEVLMESEGGAYGARELNWER